MTDHQSGGGVSEEPKEYPHVPAAFINAIADEGTKKEAIEWLQKTWNEACWLRSALRAARQDAGGGQGVRIHTTLDNAGPPRGLPIDRITFDEQAPDGLSREQVEELRDQIKTPWPGCLSTPERDAATDALCDMALRSLSQPADRVSVPREQLENLRDYLYNPFEPDNQGRWHKVVKDWLSASPGAAGEGK